MLLDVLRPRSIALHCASPQRSRVLSPGHRPVSGRSALRGACLSVVLADNVPYHSVSTPDFTRPLGFSADVLDPGSTAATFRSGLHGRLRSYRCGAPGASFTSNLPVFARSSPRSRPIGARPRFRNSFSASDCISEILVQGPWRGGEPCYGAASHP
ncbi:hypothetical protein BC628DRAFT_374399 [Trametes gibbosa]|nr:hypothetical protein BC628DRAFT_374399 [Trametes gibbosa]